MRQQAMLNLDSTRTKLKMTNECYILRNERCRGEKKEEVYHLVTL